MIAVLVIDMLKEYFEKEPLKGRKDTLVTEINAIVREARAKGFPVIWVREEFSSDLSDAFLFMRRNNLHYAIAGTEGVKIVESLDYREGETVIVKKRYSAFFRTGLDDLLTKLNVTTLVLTGINTHACIRMAAIDAYQRDYDVVIPRNAVSSYDDEHHRVTLKYMDGKIARLVDVSAEVFVPVQRS